MEAENVTLQPKIAADWSLEPTTHSFSNNASPVLKLFLTSHDSRPITIYNEFMIPSIVLADGSFDIFDYTENKTVDQIKTRYCDIPPPSKVKVPLREHLFHTLYPGEPVVFTATFGTSKTPSRPKHECERNQSRGVHGLEIGHLYGLRPGKDWGFIRWWEYGEKDEVINPPGGKLDGREMAYKHKKTPHAGIRVKVEELPEIRFECVE
ncbi:MAG: hypothetical protein Q9190_006903 [Brigantiaea leucoxantha]